MLKRDLIIILSHKRRKKLRDSSLDVIEKKIEVKDKVGCIQFRRV